VAQRRVKRKRSKSLVLILLPALIFIGVVGWLLSSCSSAPRKVNKVNNRPLVAQKERKDGVTFIPAIYEDKQEITNY
jgi:hypothetical protein